MQTLHLYLSVAYTIFKNSIIKISIYILRPTHYTSKTTLPFNINRYMQNHRYLMYVRAIPETNACDSIGFECCIKINLILVEITRVLVTIFYIINRLSSKFIFPIMSLVKCKDLIIILCTVILSFEA